MQWMRKDNNLGLRDLITHIGIDHIIMVEVGSYAGESASMFLATGKVDKIYCVDPWKPGYDSSDPASYASNLSAAEREFDSRFSADPRVVKVKSTLQEAISSGSIPAHVDMVYIDGCHRYDCVCSDIRAAVGVCDIIAGHDYLSDDVIRAVRDTLGCHKARMFSDSSWVVINSAALVFCTDGRDVDRIPVVLSSMRRVGVNPSPVFLLSTASDSSPHVDGATTISVTQALADVGYSHSSYSGRRPYGGLGILAAPLLDELSGLQRVTYLDSDVIVEHARFAHWFTAPCRDYEVVGSSGDPCGGYRWRMADVNEARRSLPGERFDEMQRRVWSRNPLETHVHFNPGVFIFNLMRVRDDIEWYKTRMRWFWDAVNNGFCPLLPEDFVNIFMDSAALLDPYMHMKDGMIRPENEIPIAAYHYVGIGKPGPHPGFDRRASELGLV